MEPQEQTPSLQEAYEGAARERDEYLAGWQRIKADFANYKKEEASRLARIGEIAKMSIANDFLSVLDVIEKAERQPAESNVPEHLRTGFLLVAKQIKDVAASHGIEEIEAVGTPFDPEIHEAVHEQFREGSDPGSVLDVVEKGYRMQGKLLRPAKVVVAKQAEYNE
ncbi:MAG: nucleotide exchange factor GrpE [Candidatus Wildermuthbacteria bacterium]|nr:nucleotide exchange factor GrpE [Candidatus Wildermuthbacteria bacterium]MBI2647898.1 nucleotide exchange factor GrpE [Candidatus Wildermuthbacteria bacterium]